MYRQFITTDVDCRQAFSGFENKVLMFHLLQWMVVGAAGQVGLLALIKPVQVQTLGRISAVVGTDSVIVQHLRMVAHHVWELLLLLPTVQCMEDGQLGPVGLPVPRVVG